MAEKIVTFKVTGLSDILMNNPESMNHNSDSGMEAKKYKPEEEAEIRLYKNVDGQFYIPTIAFLRSLWYAASRHKIGKDTARARIQAYVFVADDESILLDSVTEKPIEEYTIDTRSVVIGKHRIMRSRPRFSNWICYCSFEIDDYYIDPVDNILLLFNKAGKMIGVLDYRPQKTGPFGRYKVELK
jgi:hypothetical protein